MENEALILRARAELAKLEAEYATSEAERRGLTERSRAYESQANELEDMLMGRVHEIYVPKRRAETGLPG